MRITVSGAYGFTGRLVCRLLDERKIPFVIAGRDIARLQELQHKHASCTAFVPVELRDEKQVRELLSATGILVNCAGPFTEEAALIPHLAAASGKTCIDITGETGFVRNSFEHNDALARKTGALLLHGVAFESLPAALAMRLLAPGKQMRSIHTFYRFSHARPSPGTKLTMKLSRLREPLAIHNRQWTTCDPQHDRLKFQPANETEFFSAVPYPLPEIAFASWSYAPQSCASWLLLDPAAALFVGAGNTADGNAESIIRQHRSRRSEGPGESERMSQSCILYVHGETTEGETKTFLLTGTDMYGMTAMAVADVIGEIMNAPGKYSGVCDPASLFSGKETEELARLGLDCRQTEIRFSKTAT